MNTATLTFAEALGKHDIAIPDDLIADAEVPVLSGVAQRQGDLAFIPRGPVSKAERASFSPVPAEGVTIVKGTNSHILDAYQGDVLWSPAVARDGGVLIGVLEVPAGAVAYVTHTDEHGSNAMGPGVYRVHGKREQRDIIARVAD